MNLTSLQFLSKCRLAKKLFQLACSSLSVGETDRSIIWRRPIEKACPCVHASNILWSAPQRVRAKTWNPRFAILWPIYDFIVWVPYFTCTPWKLKVWRREHHYVIPIAQYFCPCWNECFWVLLHYFDNFHQKMDLAWFSAKSLTCLGDETRNSKMSKEIKDAT
jgi:hypothetical protein